MGSLLTASARLRRAVLFLLFACALSLPAAAELKVTVSKTAVSQFESFGITVRDPKEGLDVKPGPILVTMADSGDHQHDLYLDPTGRPGEWSGRFTPIRPGRYTGTALVDRGDEKEIGLVPLIRVQRGRRKGFLRVSSGRRALGFTNGASFFPVGVRLMPEDVRPGGEWRPLISRLIASDINFLEIPVAWTGDLSTSEQLSAMRHLDAAVVEAERTGRIFLQLRLLPPGDGSDPDLTLYEGHVQRAVRRWAYSPAVASFYLAGAGGSLPQDARLRLLRSARAADPYRHLIALPGSPGEARPGGDLVVLPWNWQRPGQRFALLEVPEKLDGPTPLPGESSWQSLVLGGVGLPVWPFRPNAADSAAVLERIRKMARAARRVPYQVPARPLTNVVSVDTPGSFCQYGRVAVGWVAPEADRVLNLSALPRGRYRVSFWDPALDAPAGSQDMWSTGNSARVELPQHLKTVFVQVEPTHAPAPPQGIRRAAPPVTARVKPAPKPAPKRTIKVVAKPRPRPAAAVTRKPTHAELRKAAAVKKAAARKEAARKEAARKVAAKKTVARKKTAKKPVKKTPTRKAATRKAAVAKKPSKKPATRKAATTRKNATVKKATAKKAPAKKPTKATARKKRRS